MSTDDRTGAPAWPAGLRLLLKLANVAHISYVPDARHSRLIELFEADPDVVSNVLTTEEEGVAPSSSAPG